MGHSKTPRLYVGATDGWHSEAVENTFRLVRTSQDAITLYESMISSADYRYSNLQGAALSGLRNIPAQIAEDIIATTSSWYSIRILCERFDELEESTQHALLKKKSGGVARTVAARIDMSKIPNDKIEQYQYSRTPNVRADFVLNKTISRKRQLTSLLGRGKTGKPIAQLTSLSDGNELQAILRNATIEEQDLLATSVFVPILDRVVSDTDRLSVLGSVMLTMAELFEIGAAKLEAGHKSSGDSIIEGLLDTLVKLERKLAALHSESATSVNPARATVLENAITTIWGDDSWKTRAPYSVHPRTTIAAGFMMQYAATAEQRAPIWLEMAQDLRKSGTALSKWAPGDQWIAEAADKDLYTFVTGTDMFTDVQKNMLLERVGTGGRNISSRFNNWLVELIGKAGREFAEKLFAKAQTRGLYIYDPRLQEIFNVEDAAAYLPVDIIMKWPEDQVEHWLKTNNITLVSLIEMANTVDATASAVAVLCSE